jgi:hypothetical protein
MLGPAKGKKLGMRKHGTVSQELLKKLEERTLAQLAALPFSIEFAANAAGGVAGVLEKSRPLNHINLSHNGIRADGAGKLVEEIESSGGGDIARKRRASFHSLTGEREHNGSRGHLVRFDVQKGQWIVSITIRHKRKVLAVNPALARIFMHFFHLRHQGHVDLLSGNGPQFISDFWKELLRILMTDTRLIINPASTPLGLHIISLCHADAARPNPYKVGDSVLLSSKHLKLELPCRAEISCPRSVLPAQPAQAGNFRQCLCPKLGLPTYVGPFTITHLRGYNAVNVKGPFRLVNPCVNIKSLRPYFTISECVLLQRTENIGPPRPLDVEPHCVEVAEIMSHTGKPGPGCRCLVRWTRKEVDTRHDSWVRRRDVSLPAIVAYERLLTENAYSHALSSVKGYSPKGTKKKIERGAAEWLLKRFIGNKGEFSALRPQEQKVVPQGTGPALTVQQNGKASIITIDDRKAVISDLANNFKRMFNASKEFMYNLKRELSNRSRKKLAILLVDMDQVPNFYQKASVETISKLPMPIFVVGSSNRKVDSSVLASKGNFHFTLAQKNKDSADAVITMAATTLHNLLVAYGRQDDVHFATISDDRIFETVTHTLRQGGAFAINISRQDAARGLKGISRMLTSPSSGMENENNTSVTTSDSERVCMECGKTFRSEKNLCWHLMQIRKLQSSLLAQESVAAAYNTKPESEAAVKV